MNETWTADANLEPPRLYSDDSYLYGVGYFGSLTWLIESATTGVYVASTLPAETWSANLPSTVTYTTQEPETVTYTEQ